ncbi:hypothetical protein J3R30DRAFT_3722867 [Lentinula aciculospora]|uniref:Uncharacterized protein n=1 Tax=Lentinula aciculospora TaxID=153920 RepID=A0A9W8ZSA0_9AGAR|nr:hypothetical protein J3R30DRAFT_3722867 [Lentinula aciculospora]
MATNGILSTEQMMERILSNKGLTESSSAADKKEAYEEACNSGDYDSIRSDLNSEITSLQIIIDTLNATEGQQCPLETAMTTLQATSQYC